MHQHVLGRAIEHLRHLPLSQPDRLPVEAHVHPHLATGVLVHRDLAASDCFRRFIVHLVPRFIESRRSRRIPASSAVIGPAVRPPSIQRILQRLPSLERNAGRRAYRYAFAGTRVPALPRRPVAAGEPAEPHDRNVLAARECSQFTGFAFTGRLREAGIRISMDGRGRCMDNIFIERLWRSLKYEAVYLHEIADSFTARRVIGERIGFYNTQRPHSALGGRTPAEAYRGDMPVDMMGKPLRALPTYPQTQQQQQEDRFKRILAA